MLAANGRVDAEVSADDCRATGPPHAAPRRPQPTRGDASGPAERVRVTDTSANGHGRAYLVERELELDGMAALWALVDDYLAQSEHLGLRRHSRWPARRSNATENLQ